MIVIVFIMMAIGKLVHYKTDQVCNCANAAHEFFIRPNGQNQSNSSIVNEWWAKQHSITNVNHFILKK